jgi:preprotein translocase subunit SecB
MAQSTNGSNGNGGQNQSGEAAQPAENALPQFNILAQYIKDFSFENPNAPRSLQPSQQQPAINLQINVNANALSATEIEVELRIDGKAEIAGGPLFIFDLVYAGVFRIQNIPQNDMNPLVMIECPRLLFPFAREIVANAVRNGGFPPLMIDPVDFVSLYRQKLAQAQAQNPASSA